MRILIFVTLIFALGCRAWNEMPEKLPGEELLLATSPNWKYYAALKEAAKVWDADINLEPRIFHQKGMNNVLYFVGSDCRIVSTAAMPDPEFCIEIMLGQMGNTYRKLLFDIPKSATIWISVEFMNSNSSAFPIKDELYFVTILAVHEFGHFLGIDHSDDPLDVMSRGIGAILAGHARPTVHDIRKRRQNKCFEDHPMRDKTIFVML